MEYYSAIKQNDSAICGNMDGPRDYHTQWSKSERGQIEYDIISMWNLKYDTNEPVCETETDSQTQGADFCSCQEGQVGKDGLGVWDYQMQNAN